MSELVQALKESIYQAFEDKRYNLNAAMDRYREPIKAGIATDEDIESYNEALADLTIYGAKKQIPDEFWEVLSNAVSLVLMEEFPGVANGTTYIKYRMDKYGFQVHSLVHQKRTGRPPSVYELAVDGEAIPRTEFLSKYCQETDNTISWSRIRAYARSLIEEGVFANISLFRYDDNGDRVMKWQEGLPAMVMEAV